MLGTMTANAVLVWVGCSLPLPSKSQERDEFRLELTILQAERGGAAIPWEMLFA